ncbi:MAG: peptidylprolyl isomerase [Patescibacteria group bacterium]|nr:peptidylprolyl isomerase [Patescibacteria group bacterium]MDE2590288.1 peptidylprolyl isomerase [Patescibacteria group bacterium]
MIAIAGILGIAAFISSQNKPAQNPYSDIANPPSVIPTQAVSPTPTQPLVPQNEWITNASSAAIVTSRGEIDIELYPADAPKTVTNFATLAKLGFYNGLTFHRVVPGFVIQGGDPNGNGTGGTSIYGSTFEDELNPNTPSYKAGYLEGVVAMANRGPNTNSSQFFIMLADNTQLPHNYTIFGKVTTGIDVVKQIQQGDKMLRITIQ